MGFKITLDSTQQASSMILIIITETVLFFAQQINFQLVRTQMTFTKGTYVLCMCSPKHKNTILTIDKDSYEGTDWILNQEYHNAENTIFCIQREKIEEKLFSVPTLRSMVHFALLKNVLLGINIPLTDLPKTVKEDIPIVNLRNPWIRNSKGIGQICYNKKDTLREHLQKTHFSE